MKNLIKMLSAVCMVALVFASCKKEENKTTYTGGTSPVLSANVTTTIPLSFLTKDNEAVKLMWTNPNYQFSTGISSQDVSYLVEIDTAGKNFTSANKISLSLSKDLSKSFLQSELNDLLLNTLVLTAGKTYNIEIRLTSTLANKSVPMTSNTLKFAVTPYAIPPKVAPPTTGHLYLVGSATAGGWNNPVPVPTQEFTQLTPLTYELTVALAGGNEYLFLPLNGDWGHKYACKVSAGGVTNTGGDFGFDFSDNFPGPAVSG
ncbi:MAG: SusE domain-containing protein, partial [Ferruginibacter sp.]